MNIYQHYREDEQPFIDQVLSWKDQVEQSFQRKLTDFVDPREQQIIEMLIGSNNPDVKMYKNGGGLQAERSRIVIAPYYEAIETEDFQLTLLQGSYHDKFISLEHRDVMGAFLSLGIKRKKLGDIHVGNGMIQIVLADEIVSYVIANLNSIKKANVKFKKVPMSAIIEKETKWVEMDLTVSSLRLDAIVKEIYRFSRNTAAEQINKSYVKVNHKMVEDGKFMLQEGDLLSVRGKGRSKLVKINGRTKKDKWKITTAILQ